MPAITISESSIGSTVAGPGVVNSLYMISNGTSGRLVLVDDTVQGPLLFQTLIAIDHDTVWFGGQPAVAGSTEPLVPAARWNVFPSGKTAFGSIRIVEVPKGGSWSLTTTP
jgi:hypothetical protein